MSVDFFLRMKAYRWLWSYLKPHILHILAGLGIVVVTSLMALINPWLTGQLVDQVIVAQHLDKLWLLMLGMLGATVFRTSIRYGMMMIFESVSQSVIHNMRMTLFAKLQHLDFPYFDRTKTGDIMARMTGDIDMLRHYIAWVIYQIFENLCVFTFSLVFLAFINVYFMLCLISLTPIIAWLTFKLAKIVRPKFAAIREQFSKLNSAAQENIAGHRVVRAFTRESYEMERFHVENAEFKNRMMESAYVWATFIPLLETLSGAMMVIQLVVGGIFVIKGWLGLGQYFVFNSLIWGLNNPIRMSGWLVNDVERFHASADKVMALFEEDPSITSPENPVTPDRVAGKVEFRNVTFSYGDETVLKNISFSVKPGTKVGIIGPTGSGKTSIARLLCRFYDCQEGSILVDDVDVRRYNLQDLRTHVGIAMQDVFLHSDTIEGNIAFGVPDAPTEDVYEAAKLANVDDFIHDMPDGYDTIIGERGVGLSGGQRQRVALARLLIKQPPIMIFDDTTSSVDVETEQHIFTALKTYAHSKTMFLIAHRIISVMDADLILVLQDGHIIEQGTHQELLAQKGYYHTVWQHQRSSGTYAALAVAEDYDEEAENLNVV